jgi:hypothetical protein
MLVCFLTTLLFAPARLVVHLRPFHLFEVACSHSRISAGLALHPVTGRSHVPWHAYHQDHHFAITMLDEDREPFPLRIEGAFRTGADLLLGHGDPSVVNIGGTVPNVVFQRPGRYRLWLTVDDQPLDSWGLQLLQLPTGLPSTAAPGTPQQ